MADQMTNPQRMIHGRRGEYSILAKKRTASIAQLGKTGGKSTQALRGAVFSAAIDKQGIAMRKQRLALSIVHPSAIDKKMFDGLEN